MVKTKNVIAALGVVAGFGVAALPLATYAVDPVTTNPQAHAIRATVAQVFELKITPNKDISRSDVTTTLAVDKDNVNTTLEHEIEVSGNAYGGYTLTMGSNNEYDTLRFVVDSTKDFGSAARYNDDIKIPSGNNVVEGVSSWAYRKTTNALTNPVDGIKGDYNKEGAVAQWTPVKANTASADLILSNDNASHVAFDDKAYVNFGVATSAAQAAGVYEGEVKYTATAAWL